MVSVLSAGPALQPRGDRGVNVLRARFGTLAPQPLPQHVLPDLVEIEGGTEPISDLGRRHRHILGRPDANAVHAGPGRSGSGRADRPDGH